MTYENVAKKYYETFGEMPPVLSTLDVENEEYLKTLLESIKNNEPLSRNDLGDIFMTNEEVLY